MHEAFSNPDATAFTTPERLARFGGFPRAVVQVCYVVLRNELEINHEQAKFNDGDSSGGDTDRHRIRTVRTIGDGCGSLHAKTES